jgi:hypothetical protein
VSYEEGLRIPMIFHDPRQFENTVHITDPVSQMDVLPTVTELLGYTIEDGVYQGRSLLQPIPKDRTLIFGCLLNKCMASLKGSEKFITHYIDQSDELYDLSNDPLERNNLVDEYGESQMKERRAELLTWRSKINAMYEGNYESNYP